MGRLDGKVALITGAARGIGAATARVIAAEGGRVGIADVLDDDAAIVAKELGDDAALAIHLDVTDEDGWRAAVEETEEKFGRLDALVNNAGILRFGAIEDTSLDDYLAVIRVNQVGTFLGIRAALPALRRAGGGSIVNVSSVDGMRGSVNQVAYNSSKFAVRGITKSAAVELGKDAIRVNSVQPGGIDTPMVRGEAPEGFDLDRLFRRIPLARAGQPEEIARVIAFLVSDDSAFCTGAEFVVDGGATTFVGWGGPFPGGGSGGP
jgi:3alpha(or 20beta)-hydroxysteroid dehydrogenase